MWYTVIIFTHQTINKLFQKLVKYNNLIAIYISNIFMPYCTVLP